MNPSDLCYCQIHTVTENLQHVKRRSTKTPACLSRSVVPLSVRKILPFCPATALLLFCLSHLKVFAHSAVLKRIITIAWLEVLWRHATFIVHSLNFLTTISAKLSWHWKQSIGDFCLVSGLITSDNNARWEISFVEEVAMNGQQGSTHDATLARGYFCHL